jgi:hypothetical protein
VGSTETGLRPRYTTNTGLVQISKMARGTMIRALLVAAATAGVIAIGAAPAANAEPPNTNCIAGRTDAGGSCYYNNCTEAKANGECDIPEGSPHYCSKQDRDSDGIACGSADHAKKTGEL